MKTVWLYRRVHSEAVRRFCIVKSQVESRVIWRRLGEVACFGGGHFMPANHSNVPFRSTCRAPIFCSSKESNSASQFTNFDASISPSVFSPSARDAPIRIFGGREAGSTERLITDQEPTDFFTLCVKY